MKENLPKKNNLEKEPKEKIWVINEKGERHLSDDVLKLMPAYEYADAHELIEEVLKIPPEEFKEIRDHLFSTSPCKYCLERYTKIKRLG